jgi:hypothetical protein
MPDQPHIRNPFNFGPHGESPKTNEQDSPEEIEDCVENILRYTEGFRDDLADFGIPDQAFKQAPISMAPIIEKILKYEPRAAALVSRDDKSLEELIERVRVSFQQ